MSNSTHNFPQKKVQSEKVKILLFCGHSRSSIAKIFYNLCTEAAKIKEEEFKNLKRIGVRDGIFTRSARKWAGVAGWSSGLV